MNAHFLNKRIAHALGFAGLIPFVAMAVACLIAHPSWLEHVVRGQRAYGIAILSFLGGIHWGTSMVTASLSATQTRKAMLWSVTPPLIGWLSAAMELSGLLVLAIGFVAAYQVDKRLYAWYQMPDWFVRMRLLLTCVVLLSLLLTVMLISLRT